MMGVHGSRPGMAVVVTIKIQRKATSDTRFRTKPVGGRGVWW